MIERDRQTGRDRDIEWHRDKQTECKTDRHTERESERELKLKKSWVRDGEGVESLLFTLKTS